MIFLILSKSLSAARSRMARSRLEERSETFIKVCRSYLTLELPPSACHKAYHSRRVGCFDPSREINTVYKHATSDKSWTKSDQVVGAVLRWTVVVTHSLYLCHCQQRV